MSEAAVEDGLYPDGLMEDKEEFIDTQPNDEDNQLTYPALLSDNALTTNTSIAIMPRLSNFFVIRIYRCIIQSPDIFYGY